MASRSAPPPLLFALLALLCAARATRAAHLAEYSYVYNLRGPQFGDWCDETDDCAAEDSKLECRNKQCVCRDGFEYSDGFCKRDARAGLPDPPSLGNWCEDSTDCSAVDPHMECRNALCECSQGYVSLNGSCSLPTRSLSPTGHLTPKPGDLCEENEDCSLVDKNLECGVGVCVCKERHAFVNGLCQTFPSTARTPAAPVPKIGDPCDETMDCTAVDENLECRNSRCECKDGHDSDGGLCKPKPDLPATRRPSVLGDWCVADSDCGEASANMECFGGVCLCKQGYVPEDGQCAEEKPPVPSSTTSTTTRRPRPQKPPQLGDWCIDDLDCALTDDNMECFSEVCLCKQGYVQREGLCKKEIHSYTSIWSSWEKDTTSKVGGLCEERSDCPPDENVECRRGFCECVDGYFEREGTCRRKIPKIGSVCNETTDVCYLEDDDGDVKTTCSQGKCQCKQGFILNNGRCKKYINQLGARCHQDRHICFLDADGNDTKTECRDGTCRCKEGFEESSGMCVVGVLNKELGSICQNDRGCSSISHAKCNDEGMCGCKEGYGPMNSRKCGKRVGDRCDDGVCDALNTQCTKKSSNRNEVSVCVCKRLHLSSSNRTYCYTSPTSIGDLCDQTPYCKFLGDDVECIEGRCQCREEFSYQNGVCV